MEKIKFFSKDTDVSEKSILIRLDFNVPINKKKSLTLQELIL